MLRLLAHCLSLIFFTFFFVASNGDEPTNASITSLDAPIRDHASRVLRGRNTGVLYPVPLPANLSGISASTIRLRSGSLWIRGTNSTVFDVPSGIMLVPYAMRLIIVYQDIGNRSSSYYNITGYSLVSPVVSLLAYDSSNTSRQLDFRITRDPIRIAFPRVELRGGANSTGKCAMFRNDGSTYIGDVADANVCWTKNTGRFAIVVPNELSTKLPDERNEGQRIRWRVVGVAVGAGFVGLMLVVLSVVAIYRMMWKKKVEEMERKADDGETLGTVWVGSSKMPSATMMRTQPAIENTEIPP